MKRGTIVLTPFPFTDLSGQKIRPALVVSRSDRAGSDVLLAFITSGSGALVTATDLLIQDTDPDFPTTGLKRSSIVKLEKLVTVASAMIPGELGQLSPALLVKTAEKLRYALDL